MSLQKLNSKYYLILILKKSNMLISQEYFTTLFRQNALNCKLIISPQGHKRFCYKMLHSKLFLTKKLFDLDIAVSPVFLLQTSKRKCDRFFH